MVTLDRVYQAKHRLYSLIRKTDLIFAPSISKDSEVYLKAENLQITGSFKVRGASFKISNLSAEEKACGVVASSAGNHAQGVALSAKSKNIKCTIFMPSTSPISKVEATKNYGAEVVLIDGVYDDAFEAAKEFQIKTGATFIHPFDDADVIAGQGTIGLEILEQLDDVEAVILPIGGGGLAAGVGFVIKELSKKCKVFGVQAKGASSMSYSMENKQRSLLKSVSTFADGIAVKMPGELTFGLCSKYIDEIVSVSDDETAAAILMLIEKQKMIAEGAGAVAVAAAMFNKLPIKNKKTVCLVSGGNIDVNILSRVINRGLLTSGRLSDLTVELLDKPGQLRDVSAIIAKFGANVIRVNHNFSGENTDINECVLRLSLETRNSEHLKEIKIALKNAGYKVFNT